MAKKKDKAPAPPLPPQSPTQELDKAVKKTVDAKEVETLSRKVQALNAERESACHAEVQEVLKKHNCTFRIRLQAFVDDDGVTHHRPLLMVESIKS